MKQKKAIVTAILAVSLLTACEKEENTGVTGNLVPSVVDFVNTTTATTENITHTEMSEEATTVATEVKTSAELLMETETAIEPVETVSNTEVVEESNAVHWDTMVYDTTSKVDVSDWERLGGEDEITATVVDSGTSCVLSAEVARLNIPDAVTSYLYENSETYKISFDNNEAIRGIASGVKDFDSDGVNETFYAVNYFAPCHDESIYDDWTPSIGRMGSYPSDIVIYDNAEEKVYPCNTDTDLTCVGFYYASDPAMTCESLDTSLYGDYATFEGTNMYFTDDNVFISCNLGEMDYMWRADTYNSYIKLVYENGEYKTQSVGTAGWYLSIPFTDADIEAAEDHKCYRYTYADDNVTCIVQR